MMDNIFRATDPEEGASATLVVLSMFVLLAAGALAVDIGAAWAVKRNLVADTDAAALAAAFKGAETNCYGAQSQIETEAVDFLRLNNGGEAADATPTVTVDCAARTVTVEVTGQSPTTLAGALGVSVLDVYASSTATFRTGASLLRPLTTCVSNPVLNLPANLATLNDPDNWETREDIVITFSNDSALADSNGCELESGNWGWLCFDGECGSGENTTDCGVEPDATLEYMRCGFAPPGFTLGTTTWTAPQLGDGEDPEDESCHNFRADTLNNCETKTGNRSGLSGGSVKKDTPRAVDQAYQDRIFPVILFEDFKPENYDPALGGPGADPAGLLWVEFNGYCFNVNNDSELRDGSSVDWVAENDADKACTAGNFSFALKPLYAQFKDGEELPDAIDAIAPGVELCSVDNDPVGASRCP